MSDAERTCPSCGHATAPNTRFCGQCGTALATPLAREAGERRQLTVVFCDLVGSTELSTTLDPEDLRELIHAYQQAAGRVIARYGGHVAQYLGDGLLVYFGWPQTYDDAAERALRASLDLANAVAACDPRLVARIGVHTGTVVVSAMGDATRTETLALGNVPNVAARVQALAEPGQVLASAATHRLVSGLFVVEEQGAHPLKGVPEPVVLYRIVRPSGVRRLGARALAPFVGRDDERRALRDAFARASAGRGGVVLIEGEPGMGKSRLAQALREDLADVPHTWLEAGGAAYLAETPFYAVTELLQQLFVAAPDASRLAALEEAVAAAGMAASEAIPVIAPLLDPALATGQPPLAGTADTIRRRRIATMRAWVGGTARAQPLVVLVEDLQWVDPSTLELLAGLVDDTATLPLLLLCTARPEFHPPWSTRSNHVRVRLDRLDPTHTAALVERVAKDAGLPAAVRDAVVARTEGVPLFVEELTRAVVESGARAVEHIPATLADSLMARLDRLGPTAKEAAQVAAVLGREFDVALLRSVHPTPDLDAAIDTLVGADLIHAVDARGGFAFKHALIQGTAYDALLRSRRRALHGAVARALVADFSALAEARPEVLARHWTEAAETALAVAAWQRAGEQAVTRAAPGEAERHLRRGLELLATLPESAERDQHEFGLRIPLGQALQWTRGYSARETQEMFDAARALADRVGDPMQLAFLVFGLWVASSNRDGAGAARPLADQFLASAERTGLPPIRQWAHFAQAVTRSLLGDLTGARDHCRHAMELQDDAISIAVPLDPTIATLAYAARVAWQLGCADEARALTRRAIERASARGNAAEIAWAEQFASFQYVLLREFDLAGAHAELALAACAAEASPAMEAMAHMMRWVVAAERGDPRAAAPELRTAIERYRLTTTITGLELFGCQLADVLKRAGDPEAALAVLERTLAEETTEPTWRPDSLRRRAELLAERGADASVVGELYDRALALAREMQAAIYELRIATSQARWLADHGRGPDAAPVLADAIARVAAGGDCADLRDGRAMLATLA